MGKIIASDSKFNPGPDVLKRMMGLIDLTSLEGKDTKEDIRALCEKARLHQVAAVCVYPMLVRAAKKFLEGSPIRTASVAGGFPGGQIPTSLKEKEVSFALAEGADEIDMVINRGKFLEREYGYVADEISALKSICGKKILKVILETGELGTTESIQRATALAIKAGADFVKTSTGKISVGATPESVFAMTKEVKQYFEKTEKRIGIKPSGGIPDGKTATLYFQMIRENLGEDWLQPSLFRFGASRLVDSLSAEIKGMSGNLEGDGY